jgi:hypothetical protein
MQFYLQLFVPLAEILTIILERNKLQHTDLAIKGKMMENKIENL